MYTPPVTNNILEGIIRRTVMQLLREKGTFRLSAFRRTRDELRRRIAALFAGHD